MYLPKAGWKKLCYLLLFMLAGLAGRAQIYPVDVSTQVTPPYDVYLPDYASPGGEKLRIVLLQRDLAVQGYRLRFEMKIQDNGVTIMQTSKSAMPPPITLQPGIPTVLGGSDLSWYVQPQNLEFGGGYSAATYEQTRALPEGPITITFTAYDYIRSDVQVSLPSSSSFYASLDNPPLLNYPACGMQIAPISPQFINFSWLPQNTSSPNSALQTNYVFSLWAILPAGYSYQDIVQSAAPIFTTTVQQPNFVYGPGQPMLTPGLQYAWRIQAVDASGRDLFANNGFSQTCNFIYGGDSSQGIINYPDIQINAAAVGSAQGKVWWTGDNGGSLDTSGYTQYELYYRQSQGDNAWFSDTVSDTMYRLFNLEPNTAYECRIQGYKGGTYGPYSGIATFTTAAQQAVSCTDSVSMLNPSSGSPLAIASPGMILTYGPWNVTLTTVQPVGAAGQFKGTCTVSIPFMGGTSFYATFNDLTIDNSRNVTAGNINFVSQSTQSFIDSSINNEMGGSLYGKVVSGTDTTNVNVPVSLANITQLPVTLGPDSTIASFTIPGNPPVVVTVNDSLEEVTIKDSTGSTYALNNQGQLTQLTLANGSLQNFFGNPGNVAALDTLATGVGVVNFRDADSKYAFDNWQPFYSSASTILTGQYQLLTGGSGNYYVAQKAIGAGASDIVGVSISLAPGMTADSLIFSTGTGTQLIWDPSDSTLDLLGGPAADAQNVYALYPKPGGGYYSLGKLLVSAYEQQNFTAVLVPVVAGDGVVPAINAQQIADSLNSIYNKVNVSWTVVVDSAYNNVAAWDASGDGVLTMTGSSLLSNKLVGEPAALMKSYMSARSMNKNEPYLFVLNTSNGSTGDPGGAAGDMPRGEQYGFLFLNQAGTPDQAAVVTAHELGHGQFNLEHTFSGDIGLAQGATAAWPNLMDYVSSNARRLYKYQWGQIHQPGQVLGIFESDTAGQSQIVRIQKLIQWIIANNGKVVPFNMDSFFIAPTNRYLSTNTLTIGNQTIDLYSDVFGQGQVDLTMNNSTGTYNSVVVGIRIPQFNWFFGDQSLTFGNDNIIPWGGSFNTLFYLGYLYNSGGQNGPAIQFYTHSYQDYSTLLTGLGLSLNAVKPRVITFYQNAITQANGDCNKLDVIYESIPDFVLAALDNQTKWNALVAISQCSIDEVGTNENLSVLNILNSFDPQWFYNQATHNPQLLITLINKMSSDYTQKFIQAVSMLCGPNWTSPDITKAPSIPLTQINASTSLSNSNVVTSRFVGCFTHDTSTDAYQFGQQFQQMDDAGFMVAQQGPCIQNDTPVSGMKPVQVTINGTNLYLPAFCTYYLCADIAQANKDAFFAFAVSFLMPNMIKVSAAPEETTGAATAAAAAAAALDPAVEAFLAANNLKGTAIEAMLTAAGSSAAGMVNIMTGWSGDLFQKLITALGNNSGLAAELIQNASLLNHFKGMNTLYYYSIGLARAYALTGKAHISLPDNFANVLKSIQLSDGTTIGSMLNGSASQIGSALGTALEMEHLRAVQNAWSGGTAGIQAAGFPADLTNYYVGIYNAGYTEVMEQISITTASGNTPVPDLFFFKKLPGGGLDLTSSIYHDIKIYKTTAYTAAQKIIKTTIQQAIANKTTASFTLTDGFEFNGIDYPAGTQISIQEMSKICTNVSNNMIDLIRVPVK